MKTAQVVTYPYYSFIDSYSIGNKEKGELGENAFTESISEFPIMMNVTYGKRQKDIDHLVFTYDSLIFNECKNTKEGFFMHYSWFCSHIADRFADGLPVAQYYAQSAGYKIKDIKFTLTISKLNCDNIVRLALKGIKINLIETGIQLLKEADKILWYKPIRKIILSVLNSIQVNTRDTLCDNSNSFSHQGSDLTKPVLPFRKSMRNLKND